MVFRMNEPNKNPPVPYLNPSVTTDVVIFTVEDGLLKVLVALRDKEPFKGHLALPGGFLYQSEVTEAAARRILKEKTGVANVFMEQLCTFDTPGRDPRGPIFSIAYVALIPRKKLAIGALSDTQQTSLVPVHKMPALSFDHRDIVRYAVKRLRAKLGYSNIAYSLLPEFFTLTELQTLYEVILGKKLDKRNFRKKILRLGLVRKTGKVYREGRQRPAFLFRFVSRETTTFRDMF